MHPNGLRARDHESARSEIDSDGSESKIFHDLAENPLCVTFSELLRTSTRDLRDFYTPILRDKRGPIIRGQILAKRNPLFLKFIANFIYHAEIF